MSNYWQRGGGADYHPLEIKEKFDWSAGRDKGLKCRIPHTGNDLQLAEIVTEFNCELCRLCGLIITLEMDGAVEGGLKGRKITICQLDVNGSNLDPRRFPRLLSLLPEHFPIVGKLFRKEIRACCSIELRYSLATSGEKTMLPA